MANLTNDGNQSNYQEFYCHEGIKGIHQRAFVLTLNILISVAAFQGNALIIAALPKVSSLHPSSKLLLKCLVWSDLGVGLFSEPFYIAFLLSRDNTSLCHSLDIIYTTVAVAFCGVSIQTITAISVDRLLALSLGLRYRQTVTNYRASESLRNYVLAFEQCSITNISIQRTNSYLHHLYRTVNLCGSLYLLLHENLSHATPLSFSSTGQYSPRTTERRKTSSEYRTIQKDSIQCTMGPGVISGLLSSIWFNNNVNYCTQNISAIS